MELVRQALCTDFSKLDRLFSEFSFNRWTSTALSTILGTSLAVIMSLIGGLTLVYTYVVDLNDQNQAVLTLYYLSVRAGRTDYPICSSTAASGQPPTTTSQPPLPRAAFIGSRHGRPDAAPGMTRRARHFLRTLIRREHWWAEARSGLMLASFGAVSLMARPKHLHPLPSTRSFILLMPNGILAGHHGREWRSPDGHAADGLVLATLRGGLFYAWITENQILFSYR